MKLLIVVALIAFASCVSAGGILRHYKSDQGLYVARDNNGYLGAYQSNKDDSTKFWLHFRNGKITLTSNDGPLACLESDNSIRAFGNVAESRCQFEEIGSGNNYIALKAANGNYVCPVEPSKHLFATGSAACYFAVE